MKQASGRTTESTAKNAAQMGRRDFVQRAAAFVAAAELSFGGSARADAQTAAQTQQTAGAAPRAIPTAPRNNLVGIQMGPHTLLDEGAEHVMDLLQETAAINAMFVYCHAYGGDLRKPLNYLATDHGVPPKDQRSRNLPLVYVKQHDQYYKDTTLRHPKVDESFDYHDRDLFAELVAPARKRGIKIYPRILEAGPRGIVNFDKVTTVTAGGRRTQTGCWNHPEYRAFWNATVEDLFRSYDVDGFQWGAERQSPFVNLLTSGNESSASCFCEHCRARGKAHGIDGDRAAKGFTELVAYIRGLRDGTLKPADGRFAGFLRIMFRYPEVIAWEYQYRLAKEEVMKGMYDTIKKIKPAAPVGWHIDHWAISMNPVYRAEMSYAELAPWSDFLKVVMYHASLGPRTASYLGNMQRGIMGDVPIDELFSLHYDLLGYDKTTEPNASEAPRKGFSPEYVYRETKHSVASLAGAGNASGKTKIYPGIAFNLPASPPDDPETIYQCVLKAYEAGADGVVASREYEEMTVPNLRGFGRAVRELKKGV